MIESKETLERTPVGLKELVEVLEKAQTVGTDKSASVKPIGA
jgi:hypothetical protein